MTCADRGIAGAKRRAFSLLELVTVVVIIGIIAAIAVPRMTQASQRADLSAIAANLNSVSEAIDMFYSEHGRYPGYLVAGGEPDGKEFVRQLTLFTDRAGNANETGGQPYVYGPYLRKPFPMNPINRNSKVHVKKVRSDPGPPGSSAGWIAILTTGEFFVHGKSQELEALGFTSVDGAFVLQGKGG